jgi:hypothetical protein
MSKIRPGPARCVRVRLCAVCDAGRPGQGRAVAAVEFLKRKLFDILSQLLVSY